MIEESVLNSDVKMVTTAAETPSQAEVIFLVEATAANSAYIAELKSNYIVPTLEFFHGGNLDDSGGNGTVYAVVEYRSADCHPGCPVYTHGPFTNPMNVVETVDQLQYISGHSERFACITEALDTALACFDELAKPESPKHILLVCTSSPYTAYAGGFVPQGSHPTIEKAARAVGERGISLSILSSRRATPFMSLYEHAGGDLHAAQQRNYAKDPRHLVLLRGYSLKERPPSPAPPPAPEVQSEMNHSVVPGVSGSGATVCVVRGGTGLFSRGVRSGWIVPPRAPLFSANNSALLTQLAQPSYPPPATMQHPQTHTGIGQRMPTILGGSSPSPSTAPGTPVPATPGTSSSQPQPPQRTYIWSGVIEWMEKGKGPGEPQKVTKILPCQVSASSKDIEPEVKVDTWPNKLLMQLMPKQLISNIGGHHLKDSKSVLFHLQHNEAQESLTKVMMNGFAGCVHFSMMSSPPQCDIKVLILLYTPDKNAFLGFIPNNQVTFVDRLKKVIQQQKVIQNKQLPGGPSTPNPMGPNMAPSPNMAGTSGMGGPVPVPMGNMAPSSSLPTPGIMQPAPMHNPQQVMMMGGNMANQVNQGNPVGQVRGQVSQLDGLEAARQQNLEKIHQLQQTLEAAQKQEAQFKSQMDIMSTLQVAKQQEQQYKLLEEQRRHQMQQQMQQQLHGAGAGPGLMRPMMPSNPGLRHLLQQQPQYGPGGGATRPPSQPQQFDDVSNYSDFL